MATASVPVERTVPGVLLGIVKSLRPKQVTKNGLILFVLFFTVTQWWDRSDIAGMAQLIGRSFAALAIFTLITSAVYLLNDIFDVEGDRAHPRKRHRPIAAGIVPIALAVVLAGILGLGGLALAFLLSVELGYVGLAYAGLMQAYNLFLKSQVILDVMSIAAGFVARAVAGVVAIDGSVLGGEELNFAISPWLYICTALGALFIALAKRRSELVQAGLQSGRQQSTLDQYTVPYLDALIAMVTPATLVAYSLYTFSGTVFGSSILPKNNSMMLTIPFVAYGLFRYLYLTYIRSLGESPEEILLTDKPLLMNIILWLGVSAAILLVNQ